ncbi:uncharacterized protein LOC110022123 [Phalaenopsis equestris]|uniref:uncharacterized protein LOC110022123 n=1 Tax=Phalaenopsis equestris TaxID=78828 RepID=UPI0009E2E15F|nr:uncharacterized protein LOC110022123 [Phalaenopsis equestris]
MLGAQQFRTQFFMVPNPPKPIMMRPAPIRMPPVFGEPNTTSSTTVISAAQTSPIAIPCAEEEEGDGRGDTLLLPLGLRREALPKHVAVIRGGRGGWAASKGMPASAGHEAGCRSLQGIAKLSCKWGIRVLTVFAFSSENWQRPKPEVDFLMMLFEHFFKNTLADFLREGIRLRIIGDSSKLPKSLQNSATELEEITRNNSGLDLLIAVSYSGRTDIVRACQKIAEKVKHGILKLEDITECSVAQELETSCAGGYAYPDLLIRTSGELRLSNFLLWELAYTELYFARSHWPDFGEYEYAEALRAFQKRQRRFGLRTTS